MERKRLLLPSSTLPVVNMNLDPTGEVETTPKLSFEGRSPWDPHILLQGVYLGGYLVVNDGAASIDLSVTPIESGQRCYQILGFCKEETPGIHDFTYFTAEVFDDLGFLYTSVSLSREISISRGTVWCTLFIRDCTNRVRLHASWSTPFESDVPNPEAGPRRLVRANL